MTDTIDCMNIYNCRFEFQNMSRYGMWIGAIISITELLSQAMKMVAIVVGSDESC